MSHEEPESLADVARAQAADPDVWDLRLYVAGKTARSVVAFENLKRLCEQHLPGKYKIEGNADAPLDKESRAEMQRHVDRYYRMFVESVARNRATTVDRVESARGGSWARRMPFGARWLTE